MTIMSMGPDEGGSRLSQARRGINDSPLMLRPELSSPAGFRLDTAMRSELSVPYEIKEDEGRLEFIAE